MTPPLILEVLDGRAAVTTRTRIETLPATIGRGYDNDLVLDDPYVCPTHVRIIRGDDGGLLAEDIGSVNGLYIAKRSERIAHASLQHGTELRIGRTIVRCCDPAHPLPATRIDEQPAGRSSGWLTSAAARVSAIGIALVVLALFARAGSIERAGAAKIASQAAGILLILALWASAWAVASRLVSHRFAFTWHLAFASLMTVAFSLYSTGTEWANFFVPTGTLSTAVGIPLGFALGTALLYGHLGIASGMSRKRRLRAALVTTGLAAGLIVLFSVVGDQKFTTALSYEGQLKPVPAALVPAVSVDHFTAEAQSLRDEVDKMAADSGSGV